MTTKPDPVVGALELGAKADHRCSVQDSAWLRKKSNEALPIARELVEYKEGLEWILKSGMNDEDVEYAQSHPDCPPFIKRLIEEKT